MTECSEDATGGKSEHKGMKNVFKHFPKCPAFIWLEWERTLYNAVCFVHDRFI